MLLAFLLLSLFFLSSPKIHAQSFMDAVAYFKSLNYPVQQHTIQTQDGYLLTFFRIQKKGTKIQNNLKPVWLQHGLFDSSDTWVMNDQKNAPGLVLANKGYDVWLGNSRGNYYSKGHIRLNPKKDSQYWDFTFQHMAEYDLPASFTYIYRTTGQKVSYIGHSQGTLIMHAALSMNNPTVESLLDKYFAFGPLTFTNHQEVKMLNMMMKSKMMLYYKLLGIHQVMKRGSFGGKALVGVCGAMQHVCDNFVANFMDTKPELDNYQRMDVFAGHFPSGTSTMNVLHLRQIFLSGAFQAYDYGSETQNLKAYGQPSPPMWSPENITSKIRLFAGKYDKAATKTDIDHFWSLLKPQVKQFYRTYEAGHATFLAGVDTSPWLSDVFSYLEK